MALIPLNGTITPFYGSGYLFKLFGGVVSWCSKKQKCVALSSTEAELIALTEASKEGIWIQRLLCEIDQMIKGPIIIYEDNQSCIKLSCTENSSNRSKHIATRYFFIRDCIENNLIDCKYCPTENMIADILTKPLNRLKFTKLRNLMGLHD